ncbi:MAG: outer membrane beta-barrel protein [Alphaproteobacteria bacterium]
MSRKGRRLGAALEAIVRGAQAGSVFAAFMVALAPVNAFAQGDDRDVGVQERSRPEYDPAGLRLGAFNLNASAELSAQHDDNLFATESNAESDLIYMFAPQAILASDWSRDAIVFSAGGAFPKYDKFSSEEINTDYLGGYGRLDLGSDSHLAANLRTERSVEPRTDPGSDPTRTKPVTYDLNQASVTADHTFNRFRLVGTVSSYKYDYDGADQSFRDHTENNFSGRLEVAISPRLRLVGEVDGNKRDYDNDATLSSNGHTFLAGVSVNFTNLVHGEFSAGRFSQDYPTGAVDGTALAGNIKWLVTGLTTIGFQANRDVEESAATTAAPFVSSRYVVSVDHELLRNVLLHADLGHERRQYQPPVILEDSETSAHAEIKYFMNRHVAVRLAYAHERNDSSGVPDPHRDFDVNTILAGFTFRL